MERTRDNGSDDRLDGPVLDTANGQDYYKTNGTPRSWPESCVSRGPSTASCPPSAWGLAGSWGALRPPGADPPRRWSCAPPPRPPSPPVAPAPSTPSMPSPSTSTLPYPPALPAALDAAERRSSH